MKHKVIISDYDRGAGHYAIITKWLHNREAYMPFPEEIPKYGFMAYYTDAETKRTKAVAAGFIRMCEGGVGQVDGFCTDPDVDPEIRHICLDVLLNHIINTAKASGVFQLMAFTEDSNTLIRAMKHGFKLIPKGAVVSMRL